MEEALQFLKDENRKFEGHWLWGRLGYGPQEFFQAFERHLNTLQIPKARWERALERAKAFNKIRSKEKSSPSEANPLPWVLGLKV
jgi:hypothetical protein